MDLSSILTKLKEAREFLTSEAPDVLLRISEFATKVAEATKEAADFLREFEGEQPESPHLMAMAKEHRDASIEEFEAFHKEVKKMANQAYTAKKGAAGKTLPPSVVKTLSKMLAAVTTRIHDKIEDHTEEE